MIKKTKDVLAQYGFEIGDYTYGLPVIRWPEGARLKIGKFCSIADGVEIFLGGNHNTDWLSTYPFSALSDEWPQAAGIAGHPASKGDVTIGNDVWLGANCVIMSGVSIGDGAVVGTRSVVTKDVAPYSIVAGNPARMVKKRFSPEQISSLLALRWWDWDKEDIARSLPVLCSPHIERFLSECKQGGGLNGKERMLAAGQVEAAPTQKQQDLTSIGKAVALFKAGRIEEAEKMCELLVGNQDRDSADANTVNLLGVIAVGRKDYDRAVEQFGKAISLKDNGAEYHYNYAYALEMNGSRNEAAIAAYARAIELSSNYLPAYSRLARLLLPGEPYLSLLQKLHAHLKPSTYLEIGVARGDSIAFVNEATLAIGVDPSPNIKRQLAANIKIFAETSDAFFAGHDVVGELGGKPLEMAFIDGMHRFEYALRDFMNVEKYCRPNSVVLLHDCYPVTELSALPERKTDFWTGDVWKVIVCLKKYRPELRIHTIAAPPAGLAMVTGLDPSSTFIENNLDALYREFGPLGYSYVEKNKTGVLNLLNNDWDVITTALFDHLEKA
jgi:acetyltransferase-like isoleucine patch superfamily enzyme/tetratricopeptide (TPR) repeat protein